MLRFIRYNQLHRLIALSVVSVLAMLGVQSPVAAQSQAQIEAFRNLPPDQQRAVVDAMRGGSSTSVSTNKTLEFPQTVQPRSTGTADTQGQALQGAAETSIPRGRSTPWLKPGDTILLDLQIKTYEEQSSLEIAAPGSQSGNGNVGVQGTAMPSVPSNLRSPNLRSPVNVASTSRTLIVRSDQETQKLRGLRDRMLRRNPYRLDKWGIFDTPELGAIPLGGLTTEEAIQRLAAEGSLRDFVVKVMRLPLDPVETAALKPFGYDLFAGVPSTFAPATDVPVPAEYVVGPGDTLIIQLTGNTKGQYSLIVGRDGQVDFPDLGPVAVSGRRFVDVRSDIEQRVQQRLIGTQANVSIGELRSIRVFVLGEAQVPGSYTVSGLSTITNALFVSGGVKEIGSLRNIQLKRDGRVIGTLDLYDLLIRGDTSADQRLLPGDAIFIPPARHKVSVAGAVLRPAIYELRGETTAADVVALAGGLAAQADPKLATLERVNAESRRVTLGIDLSVENGKQQLLQDGDVFRIPEIRPVLENSVSLSGHVYHPGKFQFHPGMKLTDLISTLDELKPGADQQYILVRRELPPDRKVAVFSGNLAEAIAEPDSAANFELSARDDLHVFDLESGRDLVIQPLLRELQWQSRIDEPTRQVDIDGQVKIPGTYPLEPGMRLKDLLRAAGGLSESAYGGKAEVTRYAINTEGARGANLTEVDLRATLANDPSANIALSPFDHVVIKEVPLWDSLEQVEIGGEVRFPGRYPIRRGETLSSLLQRAGGLTEYAFAEGAVFTRKELQRREAEQMERLANRMQSDLAQLALNAAQEGNNNAGESLSVGQSLLASLRAATPVGRLVISLNRAAHANAGSSDDVILKDGDRLLVPRVTQEVTVIGEVQSVTSHLYNRDLSRDDYIAKSGGFTSRADKGRVYVVRANGSVEIKSGNSWFSSGGDVRPGDTIVVPLNADKMRPLPFWAAVTQIIYHLAVSVAAVNSF